MNEKLKSCPFCEGEAKQYLSVCSWVECKKCGVKTPQYQFDNQSIAAWNTRAADENPVLTIEELQKINDDMENRPWVWIEVLPERSKYSSVHIESAYYQAHSDYTEGEAFCCGYPGLGFHFEYEEYGKTWLAYKRKPEDEQN